MKAVRFGSYSSALHHGGNVVLGAAEVDEAIGLLVAAALPRVVMRPRIAAATVLAQTLDEGLHGLALPQLAAVHLDQVAAACAGRIECLECHCPISPLRGRSLRRAAGPLRGSHRPSSRRSEVASWPLKRRCLPLRTSVLTAFTLTPNRPSTAFLISGFVARTRHVEDDLVVLGGQRRLFGDRRALDDVVVVFLAHLNRASSASTAALVSTSFLRRRMS